MDLKLSKIDYIIRLRLALSLILLFGSNYCYSQKEDYNWIIGQYGMSDLAGFNYFSFVNDSFNIFKTNEKIQSFGWTNSTLSNKDGQPILYSNGMHVFDKDLNIIENGDKINYNDFWNINEIEVDNGKKVALGLQLSQGMLMLPWPERDSVIWLAPDYKEISGGTIFNTYKKDLFFGVIDIKGVPKVVVKDSLIVTDSITSSVQACRHANGRDWWVIIGNHNKSKLYSYLIDPNGVHLVKSFFTNLDYLAGLGQSCFSPLGNKFAIFEIIGGFGLEDQGHLSILDFDRCTGEFSNLRYKKVVGEGFLVGCAISQSGQYLYTGNSTTLTQYDLFATDVLKSEKVVAKSDGFQSVYNEQYKKENLFIFMQLAPDGKIYGPGGNTLHMHRMEYPDEKGEACTMTQHAINTVNNSASIPNFPYFRLGPEDGSDCDTLGLDNHPIAKFRYEVDTLDHLRVRFTDLSYFRPETWTWDFGDGTTFDGKKPYYHTFPKNGTYKVCLTVSNENSSNTVCRTLTIGTTSSIEQSAESIEIVSVFPNPIETEMLLTISDYIPEHGVAYIYDMMGRVVHKQRVYYGWNNVDASLLTKGNYLYEVRDGGEVIGRGKVVKM